MLREKFQSKLKKSKHKLSSSACKPGNVVDEEQPLPFRELSTDFRILETLGSGTYGRCLLAECRRTKSEIVLKILPKNAVSKREFLRELHLARFLSPHPNVVDTFDVAFETDLAYVMTQERSTRGDLFDRIEPRRGLRESAARKVASKVASAVDFIHSMRLVHRDVKPENVLIFDVDFERVKLTDFGMTRSRGTKVRKVACRTIPYTPVEVCRVEIGETYSIDPAIDVWSFGVLIYSVLTGNFPWNLADSAADRYYNEFVAWSTKRFSSQVSRPPTQWRHFNSRLLRLLRGMLKEDASARWNIGKVRKHLDEAISKIDSVETSKDSGSTSG